MSAKKQGITPKMKEAIPLLAEGTNDIATVAKKIGVEKSTVYKWLLRNMEFRELIRRETEILFKTSIPEVYMKLSSLARNGQLQGIKIFLEHLERIDRYENQGTTITFCFSPPSEGPRRGPFVETKGEVTIEESKALPLLKNEKEEIQGEEVGTTSTDSEEGDSNDQLQKHLR
jgi:hypothetical protein